MAVAVIAGVSVGCVEQLPPPEAPAREVSDEIRAEAFSTETAGGEGVVVFDTVGEPAEVEDLGSELDGAGAETICSATPCVATLARGEHRVVFHRDGRDDEVTLTVGEQPTAVRHVMSFDSGQHQEYIALATAGLILGGASGLLIPALVNGIDNNTSSGGADAGLIVGVSLGGAALVAGIVGVVLAITDPQQTREGAFSEWQLSPPQ